MILATRPLGMFWPTLATFLLCIHHDDSDPLGKGRFGPAVEQIRRHIGADFSHKDGWSLNHGGDVPGFPAHSHRDFEAVTLVRRGPIEQADSLGAEARRGDGDALWLTAGVGIVRLEMFPLLDEREGNPLDTLQIWPDLPGLSRADRFFRVSGPAASASASRRWRRCWSPTARCSGSSRRLGSLAPQCARWTTPWRSVRGSQGPAPSPDLA